MNKKQTRSEARTEAFKLIFQSNMHKENIEGLFDHLIETQPECLPNINYIKDVVNGVLTYDEQISEIIKNNLSGSWKIERLSKPTLCILKLAVYEMKYIDNKDVPMKVAVNEALELTKTYDEPEFATFVNGVLGGVYKQIEEENKNN